MNASCASGFRDCRADQRLLFVEKAAIVEGFEDFDVTLDARSQTRNELNRKKFGASQLLIS
jgi:hypothetical protein